MQIYSNFLTKISTIILLFSSVSAFAAQATVYYKLALPPQVAQALSTQGWDYTGYGPKFFSDCRNASPAWTQTGAVALMSSPTGFYILQPTYSTPSDFSWNKPLQLGLSWPAQRAQCVGPATIAGVSGAKITTLNSTNPIIFKVPGQPFTFSFTYQPFNGQTVCYNNQIWVAGSCPQLWSSSGYPNIQCNFTSTTTPCGN